MLGRMDARYGRWDGTQDPLGERVDVGDVLEQLSSDLLHGTGGRSALRRLIQQGVAGRPGLEDLRRRVQRLRQDLLDDLDLDEPMRWVSEELDRVVELERAELAGRSDAASSFAMAELELLPADAAGRLRALEAYLRDLAGAVDAITEEDVASLTRMLADLNEMLAARARGDDVDFDGFMAKHSRLFPERPATLDELLEVLARRAMAMQRLLQAMTPSQRAQLADLSRQVLDDLDLQFQLSQLQGNLAGVLPDLDLSGEPTEGGEGPLSSLVDAMERVGELEALEEALGGEYAGATLEDIDDDALRRNLGVDAVRDLRGLRQIEQELERAGVLQRAGGELVLTPRGARLLGERALTALLERVRRQPSTRTAGADPEPTGQSRPWRFGDVEPLAVTRTVSNAVMRRAAGGGTGPMRLLPDDLEVVEQEVRPRTATALLLDLSFSMPMQGHYVPAKRMALALHALIEGKHRQDSLYLVGFSDYARQLQPADLAAAGFERVYGTNMQHAFLLARRLLANDPRPVKQVIMVTDGEPTAHLVGSEAVFNWPPVPETLEATLREAMRLARSGIALNIFLLEDAPGLVAFAERLAALTGGTVFQMSAEEVGRTVVSGYMD